jgi:hypothetical protein
MSLAQNLGIDRKLYGLLQTRREKTKEADE